MDTAIRKQDGWLALAGLFWLHEGENTFGSADTNDIVLPPSAPPRAGVLYLTAGRVHIQPAAGDLLQVDGRAAAPGLLEPDTSDHPTRISLGPLTMVVLQRGDRLGVRLWDNSRPSRNSFPGRQWFPVDPSWRLEAEFIAHDPPHPLAVPNVLGDTTDEAGVGRIVFTRRGQSFRLEALDSDSGGLWLIFADRTNAGETYPAGRFLVCPGVDRGRVVVDFNQAYNPPCAFTEFATCPLPPRENILDLRIEAGERYRPTSVRRD